MHGEPGHVYDPSRPGDRGIKQVIISCMKLFYVLKMKNMKNYWVFFHDIKIESKSCHEFN